MKKTVSIIKQEIVKSGRDFLLSAEVVIKQGKNKIIDFPISARYNPEKPEGGFSDKLRTIIQVEWDAYTEAQAVLKSKSLAAVISSAVKQAGVVVNKKG